MQRPCGQWSETPCHIDCATVGEWNAATYAWATPRRSGKTAALEAIQRQYEEGSD